MAPSFGFTNKRGRVDWRLVDDVDVDRLLRGEPTQRELDDLEYTAKQVLPYYIEEDTDVDNQKSVDQLVRLAQMLQLAFEYESEQVVDANLKIDRLRGGESGGAEEELKYKQEEIEDLYKKIEDLNEDLRRAESSGSGDSQQIIRDLEQQLDEQRRLLEDEKDHVGRLEREQREDEDQRIELQDKLKAERNEVDRERKQREVATEESKDLKSEVQELRQEVERLKKQSGNKELDDKKKGDDLLQRNRDISRYQRDNKLLENKNVKLLAREKELEEEVQQVSADILTMEELQREMKVKEEELEMTVEELERERSELVAQTEELSAAVEEKMSLLEQFEVKFQQLYKEWEERLASKDAEMLAGMEEREKLLTELSRIQSEAEGSKVDEGEIRHRIDTREDKLQKLQAALVTAQQKEAMMADAYYELEKDVGKEVEVALEKQRAKLKSLEVENTRLKKGVDSERNNFSRLDNNLVRTQQELEEALSRMQQYEAGVYGLPEAMREIKKLKKDLKAAEEHQQSTVRKMNALSEQLEDLAEQNTYLREEAGIPGDKVLELEDYRGKAKVETSSLRALNAQLEREVTDLEEERRKLRVELRYRAKWYGENAAKLGLTPNQLSLLEDFADDMRLGDGMGDSEVVSKLEDQVRNLQERLAQLVVEQPELLNKAGGTKAVDTGALKEMQQKLSMAQVDSAVMQENIVTARRENEQLTAQNQKLSSQVVKALERILGARPAEDTLRPRLERIISDLEKAMRDPSTAPLAGGAEVGGVTRLSGESLRLSADQGGGGGGGGGAGLVGVAALQEMASAMEQLRTERDKLKAELDAGTAGERPSTVTVIGDAPMLEERLPNVELTEEEVMTKHSLELQLIECLQEQSKKEERLEKIMAEVARYKELLQQAGDQRGLLYREHVRLRADWRTERETLAQKLQKAEGLAQEAAVELQENRRLVERLKASTNSDLKRELVGVTNKLTLVQVKEVRLERVLNATSTAERAHLALKQELMEDMEELLTITQERTGELSRQATSANTRVDLLQQDIDMCVPREMFDSTQEMLREMQMKYKRLMVERTDQVVGELKAENATEDLNRLQVELTAAMDECAHHKERAHQLDQALKAETRADDPLAAYKAANVQLKVELESANRQSDYDAKERQRLEEAKKELEQELKEMGRQLSQMSSQLHAAQEAETDHLRRLATSVTLERYRMDALQTQELQQRLVTLEAEAHKERDRAGVAEAQLHRTVTSQHMRNLELNGLREAMRKMEAVSDHHAEIGKLHEELLRMRTKELQLKHTTARAEAHRDRAEGERDRLAKRLADRESQFFGMQRDVRGVLREHESALQRIEHTARGRVESRKAAEWSQALLDLRERHRGLQGEMAQMREEKADLREQLAAAEARVDQAAHVKRLLAESNVPDALAQNVQLSEQILQLRLSESKLLREAHMLNEQVHFLHKVDEEREVNVQRIEEEALRARVEAEQKIDTVTRRMRQLQADLLEAKRALNPEEGKSDGVGKVAVESLTSRKLATMDQPKLAEAIEDNQELLMEQLESIKSLKLEQQELKHNYDQARLDHLATKEVLQAVQQEKLDLEQRLNAWTLEVQKGTSSAEDSAIEQVTAVAQATMKRLMAQVEEKEREVREVRESLAKVRQDNVVQRKKDMEEIERLNELLFSKNNAGIQELYGALHNDPKQESLSAMMQASRQPSTRSNKADPPASPSASQKLALDKTYQDLCAQLSDREGEIEVLRNQLEQAGAKYDLLQARLEEQVRSKEAEIERLVQEIEREKVRGPSKIMESLVAKLKTQLNGKDKRLAQLKEAIKQLEARLIDTMKANATDDIQGSYVKSTEAQAAQAQAMQEQVTEMKDKLQRAKEEVTRGKKLLEGKERELEKVTDELNRSETAAKQLSADLTKERRSVRSTRVRADRKEFKTTMLKEEDKGRVEELEKRVNVLQAQNQKLSRLLKSEGTEVRASLEAGLANSDPLLHTRLQAQVTEKEATIAKLTAHLEQARAAATGVLSKPALPSARKGSMLAGNQALERWEEDKKLQKKVDLLRKKLEEKMRTLEAAEKTSARQQQNILELQKDRSTLNSRVRGLQLKLGRPEGPSAGAAGLAAGVHEELRKAEAELQVAERENQHLQRVVQVDQAQRIQQLEEQLRHARSGASAHDAPSTTARRGGGGEEELEEEAARLKDQLLSADAVNLELKFEREQAVLRATKLEERLQRLQASRADGGMDAPEPRTRGGGKPHEAAAKVAELEEVVVALKRVVEKLRSENESLKKGASTNRQYMAAVNKVKELKKRVEGLEEQNGALQRGETAGQKEIAQRTTMLEELNADLRRQLRQAEAGAKSQPSTAEVAELRAEVDQLEKNLQAKARAVSALQRQLEEADREMEHLKSAAAAPRMAPAGERAKEELAAARGRINSLQQDLAVCQTENRDLKNELNAFDPAFFDEIEDLKHDHHELSRVVEQYERQLKKYSEEFGVPFRPAR
ncbi:hypothetical protein CYMTET_51864 [Cymbomonas tetramitiformis]|uniref:Centrosomal protein of 290kDa coiled-coil region domain-containing protein n=1 Tax=Cymbomonas tetramitiformis TaxID=36881 RepID=A0AAE0ERP2_9CHLO|nr:hypothetical protein CYMTET_51864 [Cymbomonas tetramitiformis]